MGRRAAPEAKTLCPAARQLLTSCVAPGEHLPLSPSASSPVNEGSALDTLYFSQVYYCLILRWLQGPWGSACPCQKPQPVKVAEMPSSYLEEEKAGSRKHVLLWAEKLLPTCVGRPAPAPPPLPGPRHRGPGLPAPSRPHGPSCPSYPRALSPPHSLLPNHVTRGFAVSKLNSGSPFPESSTGAKQDSPALRPSQAALGLDLATLGVWLC